MLGSDRGRYAPIRAPRLTCGTRVPRPPSEEDLQLWSVLSTLSNVPNAAHAVETFGPQPVTLGKLVYQTATGPLDLPGFSPPVSLSLPISLSPGLAALLAAVNLQPESYWDSDVVLNADAVVRHRQLYRLPSGQMVHWNYAHLACNVAALVASGLPLERRLGTVGMAGSMLAAGALSGGFYSKCKDRKEHTLLPLLLPWRVHQQVMTYYRLGCVAVLASRLMSRGTGVQQSVLGFSGVGYALQVGVPQNSLRQASMSLWQELAYGGEWESLGTAQLCTCGAVV